MKRPLQVYRPLVLALCAIGSPVMAEPPGSPFDPPRSAPSGEPGRSARGGAGAPLSVPFSLGDANINLSASGAKAEYQDNRTRASVGMGLGGPGQRSGKSGGMGLGWGGDITLEAQAAHLVDDNLALGMNLAISEQWSELLGTVVYRIDDSAWQMRMTAGMAQGKVDLPFASGSDSVKVRQPSGFLSLSYAPEQGVAGVHDWHSLAVQTWGARAYQRGSLDERTVVNSTSGGYDILFDARKVAEGRLQGVAVQTQFALAPNVVAVPALGVEQVRYPFQDGSSERSRRLYGALELHSEFDNGIRLKGGVRVGATEKRIEANVSYRNWGLSVFNSAGVNGLQDQRGAMLTYSFSLGGKPAHIMPEQSLAERMRAHSTGSNAERLNEASTRPIELPRNFLVKVDETANRRITIDKSCNSAEFRVDQRNGDIFMALGEPGATITDARRISNQASASADASWFQVVGSDLRIRTQALPQPKGADDYEVDMTRASGQKIRAQFTAVQNGKPEC